MYKPKVIIHTFPNVTLSCNFHALQLLLELPGVKEEDVAKLEERIQQSTQNNPTGKTSKHDKAKKDVFRKIVSGVRILLYLL